ncbi:alcohol dehydrogenase [Virgibacillus subterraneus]|uniref:Alcohol dehydrogenase n=1 Tax=Virgibacillus subterraneus TaxID=621109 RepID=A0A1H9ET04_9BACI|nr:hypothetical protein [Virgibacillus subterraneus]SEQ28779.1 alcohol dehydrogenase [Virgibacillus subterraneus]
MERKSLELHGKKKLKWTKKSLQHLKNDEVLIKTIAGAVSVGAELPQYMESDITDMSPQYPKETGYESLGLFLLYPESIDVQNGLQQSGAFIE